MELWKAAITLLLVSVVSPAEASMGLYDPKLCYILDAFLMLYGIIITALFLREKCGKPKSKQLEDSLYQPLDKSRVDTYDAPNRDPESGRARHGRRRMDEDSTYTGLQRTTEDTYREIQTKRRPKDQLYEGLSANKATYDSLNMQPLPPAPR